MNKQEFQETIRNMQPSKFFNAVTLKEAYEAGFEEAKGNTLCNSCFLDKPEEPVVPQFVADFYESIKDDFEDKVYGFCMRHAEGVLFKELHDWFDNDNNKPIETLVLMHKFGYKIEIEKEKLYTARNKTTGEYLYFDKGEKRYESGRILTWCAKNVKEYHHTQNTLRELNYWGNPLFEIEEVEEK